MRKIVTAAAAVLVIILLMTVIHVEVQPPGGVRVIVDRTKQIYIAPSCFEQAGATNNITETTLDGLADFPGYKPESVCTADALGRVSKPLLTAIPVWLGLSPDA